MVPPYLTGSWRCAWPPEHWNITWQLDGRLSTRRVECARHPLRQFRCGTTKGDCGRRRAGNANGAPLRSFLGTGSPDWLDSDTRLRLGAAFVNERWPHTVAPVMPDSAPFSDGPGYARWVTIQRQFHGTLRAAECGPVLSRCLPLAEPQGAAFPDSRCWGRGDGFGRIPARSESIVVDQHSSEAVVFQPPVGEVFGQPTRRSLRGENPVGGGVGDGDAEFRFNGAAAMGGQGTVVLLVAPLRLKPYDSGSHDGAGRCPEALAVGQVVGRRATRYVSLGSGQDTPS